MLANNSTRNFETLFTDPLKSILHDQPYEMPKMWISEVIGKVVLNDGVDGVIGQYKKT